MSDARAQRDAVCRAAAGGVEEAGDLTDRASTLAGFDAFIDRIIDVVDRRSAPGEEGYTRIATIDAFGRRVSQAAGRSGNFELVVTREKTGGNAALMLHNVANVTVRGLEFDGQNTDDHGVAIAATASMPDPAGEPQLQQRHRLGQPAKSHLVEASAAGFDHAIAAAAQFIGLLLPGGSVVGGVWHGNSHHEVGTAGRRQT